MILCLIILVFACGSDDDDKTVVVVQREEPLDQGSYEAILAPVNPTVESNITGKTSINITSTKVTIRNAVKNSAGNFPHQQFIYAGSSCPTSTDDLNENGILDFEDLSIPSGPTYITLDDNLLSPISGDFPRSNLTGNYTYIETVDLAGLKSSIGVENLNLEGRPVIIHGVAGDANIPIACGILTRKAQGEEPTPPLPTPTDNNFSTRLNDQLLISGAKCEGGGAVVADETTYTCEANQWLITLDNVNTCTELGGCTEIGVFPIIGKLIRADVTSPTTLSFFNMSGVSPTTATQRRLLREHWVRFDLNGDPVVLEKD